MLRSRVRPLHIQAWDFALGEPKVAGLLQRRQDALNEGGVSTVVLRLIACDDTTLFKAGLELGQWMLWGGNMNVQRGMFALLTSAEHTEIAALDG